MSEGLGDRLVLALVAVCACLTLYYWTTQQPAQSEASDVVLLDYLPDELDVVLSVDLAALRKQKLGLLEHAKPTSEVLARCGVDPLQSATQVIVGARFASDPQLDPALIFAFDGDFELDRILACLGRRPPHATNAKGFVVAGEDGSETRIATRQGGPILVSDQATLDHVLARQMPRRSNPKHNALRQAVGSAPVQLTAVRPSDNSRLGPLGDIGVSGLAISAKLESAALSGIGVFVCDTAQACFRLEGGLRRLLKDMLPELQDELLEHLTFRLDQRELWLSLKLTRPELMKLLPP